jgi:hypothetical protein
MWTKEDNKQLRNLIKEHKTPDEIISIMGYDKLRENPKKKYVSQYNEFILNEIFARPKKTNFIVGNEDSKIYPNETNFFSPFKTDSGQEYIVDFIYVKETKNQFKDSNVFNLSFTTKEQRDLTNYKKYESPTDRNEIIELTKRLIYVINTTLKFIKQFYDNPILLIGETENYQKINFYRNIIRDSLSNITEIEDVSEFTNGLKAYYYIFK